MERRAYGIGLVFNPPLARFVAQHRGALDYLEISPERFWRDHGPLRGRAPDRYVEIPEAVHEFEAARGDLPLIGHGVGLSIATAGPLDVGHVEQIARWHERYRFAWFSEHLGYFRLGPTHACRGLGVLLPPRYDRATLDDLACKVAQVGELLPAPFLLENGVEYAPPPDRELGEAEFLRELTDATPVSLLLDLQNLYANAVNQGYSALSALARLDLSRVRELHIAGGEWFAGYFLDSHCGASAPEVWKLLEHVLAQPNRIEGITFELDESYAVSFPDELLLEQLERARALWHAARPKLNHVA